MAASYHPAPLDTSHVKLSHDVTELTEQLAKNVHDAWAQQRIIDGWRYGATRDDARKEHPCLVPYHELPEPEKQYDRKVAIETLKAITALGYRIAKAAPDVDAAGTLERVPPVESEDDMGETSDEQARWPALHSTLTLCSKLLHSRYRNADQAAARHRSATGRWVIAAACCATVAVLLALVQLAGSPWLSDPRREALARSLVLGEFFVAVGALICFGFAEWRRKKWFVHRHKAERCRLLKFRFLTDPASWAAGRTAARQEKSREQWLAAEARRLDDLSGPEDVALWLGDDNIRPPSWDQANDIPGRIVGELKNYYLAKRLAAQSRYFQRQSIRIERWDQRFRKVPFALFLGSVIVVAVHAPSELRILRIEWMDRLTPVIIAFAAAFPVIGSGVRTWLTAHEGTRNMTRYRAKFITLNHLWDKIDAAPQPLAVFRDMWCSEQVIESDHREWLRLMTEAEWFG